MRRWSDGSGQFLLITIGVPNGREKSQLAKNMYFFENKGYFSIFLTGKAEENIIRFSNLQEKFI
jgi:hypothetical protein